MNVQKLFMITIIATSFVHSSDKGTQVSCPRLLALLKSDRKPGNYAMQGTVISTESPVMSASFKLNGNGIVTIGLTQQLLTHLAQQQSCSFLCKSFGLCNRIESLKKRVLYTLPVGIHHTIQYTVDDSLSF